MWVVTHISGRELYDTDIPPDRWCTVIFVLTGGKSRVMHIPDGATLHGMLSQLYGAVLGRRLIDESWVKILSGRGFSFEKPTIYTPLRDRDLVRVSGDGVKFLQSCGVFTVPTSEKRSPAAVEPSVNSEVIT